MNWKKIALSVGGVAAVVTPLAVITSMYWGTWKTKKREFHLLPTYTGQVDQLIALGIHSDYYPMQLNSHHLYSYLTHPRQFMTMQNDDFKNKFYNRIQNLIPKTKGVSWWNQDAKNSDDARVSNSYWQKQYGDILLYEHYLLDDDQKVIESSWAPKHISETTIQTNFRTSRDPYTRIPKGVFFGWDITPKTISKMVNGESLTQSDLKEVDTDDISDGTKQMSNAALVNNNRDIEITLNNEKYVITQKEAIIIKALRDTRRDFVNNKKKESDWFYNDWFFVDFYHRNYLDNTQFQQSDFKNWIIDSTKTNPFSNNKYIVASLKALFDASTYTENEVKHGLPPHSTVPPITNTRIPSSRHHPIYEQQEGVVGAAPMFEGALRDNQLYLFNVSSQISNLVKYGTPYGKQHFDTLPDKLNNGTKHDISFGYIAQSKEEANEIKNWIQKNIPNKQLEEMKNAFGNANKITKDLKTRMDNMKTYFDGIKVTGKTFGILTIAPGHGVSTIQSISKFSFIYKELGFKQPTPSNLNDLGLGAQTYNNGWINNKNKYLVNSKEGERIINDNAPDKVKLAIGPGSIFNMDDNGWFWNIGETGELDPNKLNKFNKSFDMGIISARDSNFNAKITKNLGLKIHLSQIFKEYQKGKENEIITKARKNADYDLWNEGIKTPFVMHMILDQIMDRAITYAKEHNTFVDNSTNFNKAKYWGDYFGKDFL